MLIAEAALVLIADIPTPFLRCGATICTQREKHKEAEMKRALWVALALWTFSISAQGQEQKQTTPSTGAGEVKPCLIVKHKSTIARRLTFTLLIGLPIAPGASYDYVDAVNYTAKPRYKGKELQQVQAQGIHVIVLEKKYTQENLDSARASCYAPAVITPTTPAAPKAGGPPAQPKQEGKPPAEQKQDAKPPA